MRSAPEKLRERLLFLAGAWCGPKNRIHSSHDPSARERDLPLHLDLEGERLAHEAGLAPGLQAFPGAPVEPEVIHRIEAAPRRQFGESGALIGETALLQHP